MVSPVTFRYGLVCVAGSLQLARAVRQCDMGRIIMFVNLTLAFALALALTLLNILTLTLLNILT